MGHLEALAVASLLILAPLAGCISSGDGPSSPGAGTSAPVDESAKAPRLPDGFAYTCPPGGGESRGEALCVRTLSSGTTSYQEPFLAIDPADPSRIAIGVNAGYTTQAPRTSLDQPGSDAAALELLISEDGGESFDRVELPPLPEDDSGPVDAGASGDPTLAWGPDSQLYVAGIVTQKAEAEGFEIFVTHTPDLGETWSAPQVLTTDSNNDRPWITLSRDHAPVLSWQDGFSAIHVLSRETNGSWSTEDDAAAADECLQPSPFVVVNQTPLFTCEDESEETHALGVFAVNTTTGALEYRARAPNSSQNADHPIMVKTEAGPLALLSVQDETLVGWTSTDAGRTWSAPKPISTNITAVEDWGITDLMWAAGDPWGGVQILLRGVPDRIPGPLPDQGPPEIVHVATSAGLDQVIQERLLNPLASESDSEVSTAPPYGDHFFGIGFLEQTGLLVWTEDRTLKLTQIEPVYAGSETAARPSTP